MNLKLDAFSRDEVLVYLGWRGGEIPDAVNAQLDACMQETLALAQPRYTWRLFDKAALPAALLQGEDIRALLADCETCILFAATLGGALENAIRRYEVRDLTRAMMLDCCGSSAIEAVCGAAERDILAALGGGTYLTDRFSPGYGDLPLEVQPLLLESIDAARRIGLTLTPGGMMLPRKSVSAILGVSDHSQPRRFRGCAYCNMLKTCNYRKAGKTCGRT